MSVAAGVHLAKGLILGQLRQPAIAGGTQHASLSLRKQAKRLEHRGVNFMGFV